MHLNRLQARIEPTAGFVLATPCFRKVFPAMSDDNEGRNETKPEGSGPSASAAAPRPQGSGPINVLSQYLKDLSFENPGAPMVATAGHPSPHGRVDVDVKARSLGE